MKDWQEFGVCLLLLPQIPYSHYEIINLGSEVLAKQRQESCNSHEMSLKGTF